MKMSDVFNLPLRVHAGSVMCEGVTCFNKPHPELHMRGINYTGDEVKLAQYTAFAINNHDQMTSKIISMQGEIAELREALKESLTWMDDHPAMPPSAHIHELLAKHK